MLYPQTSGAQAAPGSPVPEAHTPRHGADPPFLSPSRVIRVALHCPASLLYVCLEETLRAATDLEVQAWDAPGRPDVILCVAESGAGLKTFEECAPVISRPSAVLYDTAGMLGAAGAGLHGFQGYCPPESSAERLRQCLRRVGRGEKDAPRPHYETLLRVLDEPPLDDDDRKVLSLLALGRSPELIQLEAHMAGRTLRYHMSAMESQFGANDRCHLAAIAVALDLGWPWLGKPPTVWMVGRRGGAPR